MCILHNDRSVCKWRLVRAESTHPAAPPDFVGLALLVSVAAAPRVAAQVADATIEVIAVDAASGACCPGVTVTVTRPDTGFTQTIVTDAVRRRARAWRCRPAPTT